MTFEKLFENYSNTSKPEECQITGLILKWLNGTLLRNSPGMFQVGNLKYKHWFDGLAYIERYHFFEGRMYYSARFLETEDYTENMRTQRIICTSFGTKVFPDPTQWFIYRMASYLIPNDPSNNCNVAFVNASDGVYALTDSPLVSRLDIDTLDHQKQVDVRDHMNIGLHTYTAHYHTDKDGSLYNVGSRFAKNSDYVFAMTKHPRLVQDKRDLRGMQTAEMQVCVPASELWTASFYHSFGLSENHYILFESPLKLNVKKMYLSILTGWTFQNCLYWDENAIVRVIICDRTKNTMLKRKVTSEPFFAFHHANAYESDGFLIVDYVKIRNPGNLDNLSLENMRNRTFLNNPDFHPYLHRMIIPLVVSEDSKPGDNLLESCDFAGECKAILRDDGSIHCTDRRLCEISLEFPRYCYDLNTKNYRYVYGACWVHEPTQKYGVVKVDLKDCTYEIWEKDSEQDLCSEPVLVNKPDYTAEDEGVLIVPVVTVPDVDTPYVVILDAQTMDELCRFLIPQLRIPLGFHSHFVPRVADPNEKKKVDSDEDD